MKSERISVVRSCGENMPVSAGEKTIRFIQSQIKEIQERGLLVLLPKVRMLLAMVPAVPVVLLVRVLRPAVVIRFGGLMSGRIGHFAANAEVYLCERDAGMHSSRTFDIFYHTSPICNLQLKKMWDRTLHVSRFAYPVDMLNRWLPGGEKHVIPWRYNQDRDIHGLLAHTQVHLSFSPEEERLGRESLRAIGIPDGSPFVCFHARDPAYLQSVFPNANWRYHDYRDSSIQNHIPAAKELTRRGYFAIRMGAVVKEALNTSNPRIIDYATKYRTDFLDIFLGAKCHFYLGDSCGLADIPMVFRRPLAIVNMIPLEYAPTWGPNDLFIPKKLWLREERRFQTFREILDSGIGRFLESEQYEQLGIEVIENTPEEITAVAVEMDERLKGTWQTTEEDEELQRRFWALFEKYKSPELHGKILSRIGTDFLRQNRELLE